MCVFALGHGRRLHSNLGDHPIANTTINPSCRDWIAILVGVVAMQILGFLWYGPLFGKIWLKSIGKTREEMSGAGSAIAIGVVANIVAATALAWLYNAMETKDLATGIYLGLIVAVGFVITTSSVQGAYGDRNSTTALLYFTYNLVAYALLGTIIAAMT